MASIKKMKNGKFQATIYVGRDSNGKHIREYITREKEKDCISAARIRETEIEEGKLLNLQNVRLGAWLDEWLELNKNSLAPSTYVLYKGYIRTHYKPELGEIKLSKLSEVHIKKFVNKKLDSLAQNTVRKLLFVLRKALKDAMKDKNPARDIEIPQKQKVRFRLISEEEFQLIHQKSEENIFDECIILLAAWGGLRRGEIFALRPNDIFRGESKVRVDEARSISEDGYIDKRPKSENGFREIVVPQYLIDLIEKYRSQQDKIGERLFEMRPDHYSHRFKELVSRTAIKDKDIVFHDLRHYHTSWLYKNGMPDLYAAERLGHDINTLKQIYQHMDKTIKEENDRKILNMAK